MRHHFLRDQVENGNICMKYCSTKDQIADIFTKPLCRDHIEKKQMRPRLIKLSTSEPS